MENKHTPGPWQVKHSESKPALNIIGTVLGGKYKIARCPIESYGSFHESNEREFKEVQANAKLISTAPELLKVLQLILISGTLNPTGKLYSRAESIIKKATE